MIRWAPIVVWVLLVLEVLFVAPPQPDTGALVVDLFQFRGPDPLITAAFQMMGIWPLLYARVLLRGVGAQRPSPWLFVVASFFVGAFALLWAVALRRYGASTDDDPRWLRTFTLGRAAGGVLAAIAFGLLGWGLVAGDVDVALRWWREHGFVHIFGLDFLILTLGYPALIAAERRGTHPSSRDPRARSG